MDAYHRYLEEHDLTEKEISKDVFDKLHKNENPDFNSEKVYESEKEIYHQYLEEHDLTEDNLSPEAFHKINFRKAMDEANRCIERGKSFVDDSEPIFTLQNNPALWLANLNANVEIDVTIIMTIAYTIILLWIWIEF